MSVAGSSGAAPAPTGHGRRGEHGFTAIELVVTLGVIALLSSLAVPLYATIADAVRFRTAARALTAELRQARGLALRGGAPVSLAFDPEGRSYGPAGSALRMMLPEDLTLRWLPGPLAGEDAALAFFPDGSASGGELWLAGPRHQAGIAIHPLTGRLTTLAGAR